MRTLSLNPSDYNLTNTLFIVGYHLALLIGLPFYFVYHPPSVALLVLSAAILVLSQIGIGGAYHRFYAHRGYTLKRPAEAVLLFLATLATQGPALRWSWEHRMHHAFVDTDRDPYSIKKGFWYAHVFWIFEKSKQIEERRIADLVNNPLLRFQDRYYGLLMLVANALAFVVAGLLLGDWLGAFVITWWTRLAVSHHLTWFVNSLAHMWGVRTYSNEHSAVDNHIMALLTVGEGYHNYHHTFASDYRNGVRWYHFDPTKWTIFTLSKLGLAGNLKRYNEYTIRKKLLNKDRNLLLGTLGDRAREGTVKLERHIEQLADTIREKLTRMSALAEEVKSLKAVRNGERRVHAAREELRRLRKSVRDDWQSWYRLCSTVLEGGSVATV